jgi:hypothetical protein
MTQATELRELATLLDVSSGNVGIGLPSGTASNKLVISDGVRTSAAITAGTTALEIARTGGGDVGILINKDIAKWLIGIDNSDGNAAPLRFMYGAYNAAAHPGFGADYSGLNLTYDGKVGIGTKVPNYELHVKGAGDIKIEDSAGGSAHLHITSSTSGLRNSEWRLKTSGQNDEFYIDHRYTANDGSNDVAVSGVDSAFKINSIQSLYNDNRQPTVRPTLSLDFANSKQLDPRITFYRESRASYYDDNSILRYADENEPRFDHNPTTGESKGLLIEEARSNVMNYTDQMHKWNIHTNYNQAVEPNAAVAPDGTFTATRYTAIAPASGVTTQWLYQLTPSSTNSYANKIVTGSFWARSDTNLSWQCHITDNVSGSSYSYTTTTEWQRYTFVKTCSSTSPGVGLYPVFVGNEDKTLYIWGGQLETGGFATSYIPSDTRFDSRTSRARYHDKDGLLKVAPRNTARYGYKYDGLKWVDTGLILEGSSANLITHSQDLVNWNLTRTTLTSNVAATTAPDGSNTADKLEETAVTGEHAIIRHVAIPNTGHATLSIYAKAAERSVFGIQMYNGGGGVDGNPLAYFDLSAGVVNTANSAVIDSTISYAGNGWWRITLTGNISSAGVTASCWMYLSDSTTYTAHLGEVGKGVYLWGGQLEQNRSFASSYIDTAGSSESRSADVAVSIKTTRQNDDAEFSNISEWYGSSGTLYVDFNMVGNTQGSYGNVIQLVEGTSIRSGFVTTNSDNGLGGLAYRAPNLTFTAGSAGTLTFNTGMKAAQTTPDGTNFITSVNGAAAVTTSATAITNPTSMYIGKQISDNYVFTGTYKKIAYYPEKLSTTELQALTENN